MEPLQVQGMSQSVDEAEPRRKPTVGYTSSRKLGCRRDVR